MKTGIIILCHNEAKELDTNVFMGFDNKYQDYHICFVNDGSSDNTLEVIQSVKASSPKNISIVNVDKQEVGADALTKGIDYLGNKDDVSYVGFVNADLSKRLMRTLHSW